MASLSNTALHALRNLMQWWLAELTNLLPCPPKSSSMRNRRCLVLAISHMDTILVAHTSKHGEKELGRIIRTSDRVPSTEHSPDSSSALAAMAERRYREWPLIARLSGNLGLRKLVDLPLVDKDELGQLLYFELDRLTPFKAEDVSLAWRVIGTETKSARMRVELEMAPKSVINKALELANAHGRQVNRVELEGGQDDQTPLDLLPHSDGVESSKGWLNRILPIITLGLLVAAVVIPFHKQQVLIGGLEAEITDVRADAEASLALREEIDSLVEEAHYLVDAKNGRATMTEILAELTQLIPDHSYIQQLHIGKSSIEISGFAEAASGLIAVLDKSSILTSPEFKSPVTRDARSGRERFRISVKLMEGAS